MDPDEPRYLAIGRAMAATGDLITPRLWGSPWFEKPPALYWLVSLGTSAHLSPELSGRLPVALLSLCFLAVMFELLRREFGAAAASVSTALLATSAGWLAYSSLALTDLPLAVFFSLAVLLALPLLRLVPDTHHLDVRLFAIGVFVGLATLAKGLVPLVLAVPFFWFLRPFWRRWWLAFLAGSIVALPWYLLVYFINGQPFLTEFFWKHHFERLYSASLQHVQPWYYYVPIFFAAIFPWLPLFGLFAQRPLAWDRRRTFLAACFVFGFLFFSSSLNKLPGYLLPLLPAAFMLLGAHFECRRVIEISRLWFIPCALLIGLLPVITKLLPQSLEVGKLSLGSVGRFTPTEVVYIAAPLLVTLLARRSWIIPLLVLSVVYGGLLLKILAYPVLDRSVSARVFSKTLPADAGAICNGGLDRHWDYGIAFYRGALLPPCTPGTYAFALQSHGHGLPVLVPLKH